jgi:DNA-binding transcriptional MerR regulator
MARKSGPSNDRGRTRETRSGVAYLSRSVLCQLGGVTEHQLAVWEYEEFIAPSAILEVGGHRERVYDNSALRRIRTIRALAEDLGVNVPGIGVVLHLLDQLESD